MAGKPKAPLDVAYDRLGEKLPDSVERFMTRMRKPGARWLRIPLGVLCTLASFLWFLPVLGIWMLPLGLLFLAQDIPFLRRPVGKALLWALDRWDAAAERYRRWRARRRR
jgi:hypothetical protein